MIEEGDPAVTADVPSPSASATGDEASSSMSDYQYTPDVKYGIEELCPICGDKVSGYHYGLQTCESCKGFFKRTVQNKKVYSCVDNRTCHIDKSQRKRCPYCRFQKCLSVGMKLEAVRPDRMRGGRNKFGPMYKRDRALKQQAVRQRQHVLAQCQMQLNNMNGGMPGLPNMDSPPDIKPSIGMYMPGPGGPNMSPGSPGNNMMGGSVQPLMPMTSSQENLSNSPQAIPMTVPSSQGPYSVPLQSYPSPAAMMSGLHPHHPDHHNQQQQQQQQQQQHHHHHPHHNHPHHQQPQPCHPHHPSPPPQQHHHHQQQHHQQQQHLQHPHHHHHHHNPHQQEQHSPPPPPHRLHNSHPSSHQYPPSSIQMMCDLSPPIGVPQLIKDLQENEPNEQEVQQKLSAIVEGEILMLQSLLGQQETVMGMEQDVSKEVLRLLYKLCDQSLFLLVEWARGAAIFKDLKVEDQMKLLQNCWSELIILDFVYRQTRHDKVNHILLNTGHLISMELLHQVGLGDCRERLQELIKKFRDIKIDHNEFICLKFLILLNPDVSGLLDRGHVEQGQEKVNTALLEHSTVFYGGVGDKFGQLLVRLPEIRMLSIRAEDYLYYRHLNGDIPEQTLLMEMLHSKRK